MDAIWAKNNPDWEVRMWKDAPDSWKTKFYRELSFLLHDPSPYVFDAMARETTSGDLLFITIVESDTPVVGLDLGNQLVAAMLMKCPWKILSTSPLSENTASILELSSDTFSCDVIEFKGPIAVDDVCAICLEIEEDRGAFKRHTPCGHAHHRQCLQRWYRACNERDVARIKCPSCGV